MTLSPAAKDRWGKFIQAVIVCGALAFLMCQGTGCATDDATTITIGPDGVDIDGSITLREREAVMDAIDRRVTE